MPEKIVLLEFPDEVDSFVAHCQEQKLEPAGFHIVALWPNVQVALERRGLAYSDTRRYFDNESHRRIIYKSEEWLKRMEGSIGLTDGLGLKNTYNGAFIFHVRFYINYFLWAMEVLAGIGRAHEVASITVCSAPARSKKAGPSLTPADRYLARLVHEYARPRNVAFHEIRAARSSPREGGTTQAFPEAAIERLSSHVTSILHRIALSRVGSNPTILVNAITYNMNRLIAELKPGFPEVRWVFLQTSSIPVPVALYGLIKHQPANYFLAAGSLEKWAGVNGHPPAPLAQGLRQISEILRQAWSSEFKYEDVSFPQIFLEKIESDLWPYISGLAAKSRAIKYVLQKIQPALVLSPFAADTDAMLGEWTRILKIPSLSISHGALTPPTTEAEEIEKYRLGKGLILTSFAHTALQTPWTEKFVAHYKAWDVPAPLRTGNLIFAKLDQSSRETGKRRILGNRASVGVRVIVYATTLKPRSGLRFEIHETLDEHLEAIAQVATAVNALDNVLLIVKLHPSAALKENEVRQIIPETRSDKVQIECRIPFEQVLAAADLLISYSSTCIEEAIQNRIPVLLYDPWDRYQHLPALRWEKSLTPKSSPAYYLNTVDSLGAALQWILSQHNPDEIPPEVWRDHIYPPDVRQEFLGFLSDSLRSQKQSIGVTKR